MLADGKLQHRHIDDAVGLGDADALDEVADRGRRHAAPPQARQRRHARIVPAGDVAAAHQFGEHALRQHRMGQIEPGEFVLVRVRGHRQVFQKPVVKRPVILEFQRADGMGDAFDGVRLTVGEIVARINAPGFAGARMLGMQDAVEHRVAQIDIARRHVDLGAQHARAVGKFARAHAAQQIEIFLHAAAAKRAVVARFGQGAARRAHLVLRLVVDIGLAGADQVFGPLVKLLEIIRRMIEMLAPIEAEPAHVGLDGVDIFLLLLGRVGVVEAQIAMAGEFLGDAEIEADRLGVADMQVAVRLRRKPGDDRLVPARGKIGAHDVADEILAGFSGWGFRNRHNVMVPCLYRQPPVRAAHRD